MSNLPDFDFEDIRPYTDKEVKSKIALMLKDPVFDEVLSHVFKFRPVVEMVKLQLRMIRNTKQLQGTFVYDLLRTVINKTSSGLSCSGIENLDKKKKFDVLISAAYMKPFQLILFTELENKLHYDSLVRLRETMVEIASKGGIFLYLTDKYDVSAFIDDNKFEFYIINSEHWFFMIDEGARAFGKEYLLRKKEPGS